MVKIDDTGGGKDQSVLITWIFCSVLFLSLIIVITFTQSPGLSSSLTGSNDMNFTVPVVELQRKMTNHDQVRAVSSNSSNILSFSATHHQPSIIREDQMLNRSTMIKPLDQKLEQGLAASRVAIKKSSNNYSKKNKSIFSEISVYRNPSAFYRSYAEMEKKLKVYVYKEGELPIVHSGPCKNIYTSEGRFIHEIEHGVNKFRTNNPKLAQLYFLPFSITWMVKYIYKADTYDLTPLKTFVSDYVTVISGKYPFWNRTFGADHFFLSCHDWGPHASKGNPFLYNTSIRVLCNANSSEGFNPQKDVSLPEINLYDGEISPKLQISRAKENDTRPYLAFFAGGVHGPIRPILLHYWKGRDPDLQVHEYLPKNLDYYTFLLQSKFCLCPSGYEVASPRIVEAIYAECVPVILSKNYVLPFSDVLNWEAFSIKVEIHDIPRLKEVLMAIPEDKYLRMKDRLRDVRKHFVLNEPSKKFDMFHMILHSVWLRRLNFKIG